MQTHKDRTNEPARCHVAPTRALEESANRTRCGVGADREFGIGPWETSKVAWNCPPGSHRSRGENELKEDLIRQ